LLLKTTNQNWDDDFLGCSPPPVGAGAGRGSRERRPPVGEIQHPAPGRGSTSTCRDAGPPPERRAVTAGVLGRHSTEARRGVVSQPVTATRANRWMTSRARRRATSAPYRYRGCLRSCSAREELRSSLREQVSHLCLPSGTGGCGSSPPRRPCAGRTWQRRRNATPPSSSSAPDRKRGASCHEPLSRHQSLAVDLVPQAAQRRSRDVRPSTLNARDPSVGD